MTIIKPKKWHYDLASLCLGFGSTDVCNATYVAKEIFGMRMPEDYKREGKSVVSSSTVLRETYLLEKWFDQEESIFGALRGVIKRYKNFDLKAYLVGKLVASFSEDEQRLAAVYLACSDKEADANLNADEKEKAEDVIAKLKHASGAIRNFDTKKLKRELKISSEEANKHVSSLEGTLRGIETKLQTLSL